MSAPDPSTELPGFLSGGGETGALMRGYDWAATPLGPPAGWPTPLKTAVGLMLGARQPVSVIWGPELTTLYNDGYLPIVGTKHPDRFAKPFADVWAEVWDEYRPLVEATLAGEAQHFVDRPVALDGRPGLALGYFTYSFTALRDEEGRAVGIYSAATETTDRVAAAERQRQLFVQAPGFITILSGPDHVFEFVNETYVRLFGARDYVGRPVRDLFPELQGQGFLKLLDEVYSSGRRFVARDLQVGLRITPKGDLQDRYLDFIYEPVLDDGGKVTGIFCEGYDVTDTHLAQEALRATSRRQEFQIALDDRLRHLVDPAAIMETAATMLGRHLGVGRCGYAEIDATGEVAVIERDWTDGSMPSAAGHRRVADFGATLVAEYQAGRAVCVDDAFADTRLNPDEAAAHAAVGDMRAHISVPLIKEGRFVAALFVHQVAPRRWADEDERLVGEVAERTWEAVERARAEARLRESEQRFETIFANASVGLSEVSPDGRFIRVNEELCRLLGRSEDELLKVGVLDVTHPDDVPPSLDAVMRALQNGETASLDKRYRRPDGTLAWASSSIRRLDDAQVHARNLLVVTVDLTQRKAAEEALRASEEFNRRILASSADCIKVLDLDARLEFMSEGGMCVMEVEDFGAIKGACWPDFWQGDLHASAWAAVEEARQGRTGRFQGAAPTLRGTMRWWDVIVTAMAGPDGRPEKLLSISRDVSATKQAEVRLRELNESLEERVAERTADLLETQEALRQSQKLEAVGQLTGGVAHDFNNLLTIIRSSVDFLRRPDLPEERRRRYMDAVSETVDRAAKLTGQLLAFARRQALKPETVDVGAHLSSVADMLDTVSGARIRVVIEVPDAPCFVRVDPNQLETALINMGVNARDAMDGAGTLTLRLACGVPMPPIRGHAGAPGPFAAVSLADTGSGIPLEMVARIFEPFFTTKEVGKGTGLGLSQVFGFAKQSGGDVAVESQLGEGTIFTLYLPEADTRPQPIEQATESADLATHGAGRSVLVVEDNIEVGRFARQILEDLGYRCTWATNAEDALDRLGADGTEFDAVFSDVVMPGMGGIALAKELQRRLPDMPVVLASGYSHVLSQETGHGFELLQKPYSAEQVSRVLRKVMSQSRRSG